MTKSVCLTPTPGGLQVGAYCLRIGLYKLIARSRKASTAGTFAHRFTNWVFREVIPSIRKTGSYGVCAMGCKKMWHLRARRVKPLSLKQIWFAGNHSDIEAEATQKKNLGFLISLCIGC